MPQTSLAGLDKKKLRLWLVLFLLALAVPTGVIILQAYSQLKWETFHHFRTQAQELTARIDDRLARLVAAEQARSFSDYRFLVIAGDPAANFMRRSALSAYPVKSDLPGLIGYFQVDERGLFTTPLLPPPGSTENDPGISPQEREQRRLLQAQIRRILRDNRLVQAREAQAPERAASPVPVPRRRDRPAGLEEALTESAAPVAGRAYADEDYHVSGGDAEKPPQAQAAFDRLNRAPARSPAEKKQFEPALGRVEDLKLETRYQAAAPAAETLRQSAAEKARVRDWRGPRKEQGVMPEPGNLPSSRPAAGVGSGKDDMRIHTFESEVDDFEFSLLDSGHLVLFRKVWRDGKRFVQGALIDRKAFLQGAVQTAFHETALSRMTDLVVAFQGDVLAVFRGKTRGPYVSSARDLRGELLHRTRLSGPLGNMELIFSITRLPPGPGARLLDWTTVILVTVLCGGFYALYRLGARQIELARQQQDFVSAVSHELKTPLTSIRMYGEMLRRGWVTEDKRKTYYDFIFGESERLSRLIGNVLQLARLTRNDLQLELKPSRVSDLMDGVRSKVLSQTRQAGFELNLDCALPTVIRVDADSFSQILINLVDNAIKFSAAAERRVIDVSCGDYSGDKVVFAVRDYGPGIAGDQMKKIFKLFYRAENELTRETVGTGIGLALVKQLAQGMAARVDVVNKNPGAEFRLIFPVSESDQNL